MLFPTLIAKRFVLRMFRATEKEKLGKEWKFSVIESVMSSPGRRLLDSGLLETLTTELRTGPFRGSRNLISEVKLDDSGAQ